MEDLKHSNDLNHKFTVVGATIDKSYDVARDLIKTYNSSGDERDFFIATDFLESLKVEIERILEDHKNV